VIVSFLWSLRVFAGTQPPILISPQMVQVLVRLFVLDWNDVPTATSYRLQISFNSTFSAIALDQNTDSSKYTIPTELFLVVQIIIGE